jgi:hypothetical protein
MLSAAGEFLLGALYGPRQRLCPACAAAMRGCAQEDMLKASKELISHGLATAENAQCGVCQQVTPIVRRRQSRWEM